MRSFDLWIPTCGSPFDVRLVLADQYLALPAVINCADSEVKLHRELQSGDGALIESGRRMAKAVREDRMGEQSLRDRREM